MSNGKKIGVTLFLAIAVLGGLYLAQRYWIAPATARASVARGKFPEAPAFSVTDLNGSRLALSDYKGKVVLLDFWATWCPPCRMEIPGFVALQDKYRDQGFAVVGISMDDDPSPVRDFYKQFRMNYEVAMGNDKLGELYGGILGLPTTFLIGRDGRIYDKVSGAVNAARFEEEIKTLLAADPSSSVDGFKAAGISDAIEVETPAEANSPIPGIDISKLTPEQVAQFKAVLSKQQCTCGCNYSLLDCRIKDRTCGVSRKLAKEALAKFLKPTV